MLNIYRASAGSGKTFRLTQDYILLLFKAYASERPHRRILAVTFTNKATDEMKSRILQELHALANGEKSGYREKLSKELNLSETVVNERAKSILIRLLHDYSSFSISTIDKFFQQVIRSFAREIGVNGGYNLELDTETTLQQAVDNFFFELSDEGNKQLLEWMTAFLEERIEQSENWNIRGNLLELGKEIFKENYQHKADEILEKLHDRSFLKEYQGKLRKIKRDFEEKVRNTAGRTLDFLKSNGLQPEYFSRQMMFKTLENLQKGEFELKSTFLSYAEAPEKCYTAKQEKSIKTAIETAFYSGLQTKLTEIIRLISSEEMTDYNSASIVLKHIDTLGILSDLALQIRKLTAEKNVMLISDTNMLLNKVIDNSETPFVYERTGINVDHYMIDEFQDTSTLQWENFKPLISNSLGYSFFNMVVGDVKQSIYRWRNSDWKLLDEQVNAYFSPLQLKQETLNVNWRSDRNIVEFNNAFFHRAAGGLQNKLNENITSTWLEYPDSETLTSKITHAYQDVEQKISPKAGKGHVKFEFIPKDESEDGWHQASLSRLPALLENLVDNGYKPCDIAFLVRKNAEETEIIEYLLHYKNSPEARAGFNYNIVGNEGLMLASSESVNFIIAVLKLTANTQDAIQRTIMNYEYLRGKSHLSESEAVKGCFFQSEQPYTSAESPLFSSEENECIAQLRNSSLFDAVEKLIRTFQIHRWHNETVFLQAFQDVIFKVVNAGYSDMNSFLRWWNENGEKQAISAPENQNAFRIMTIHKSKGLDFKVVIMPFCDWALEAVRNRPLLWCKPDKAPFNELSLLPVEYSAKLSDSIFRTHYFDEQMHQYIDGLNMAYVAFTRARNEMICFLPKPKDDVILPLDKVKNLSDLLQNCLLDESFALSHCFNAENNTFEIGEAPKVIADEPIETASHQQLDDYPSASAEERLKIRRTSADYWKTAPLSESRVNYGTLMHAILQKTVHRADEEKAIDELRATGKISENDLPEIREEFERFWSLPEVHEWFTPDVEILNECTILLPSGEMYRPDRVILKSDQATVIDYKFGEEERAFHVRQLQRYAGFLREMGYKEVKAMLYYVSLGKITQLRQPDHV